MKIKAKNSGWLIMFLVIAGFGFAFLCWIHLDRILDQKYFQLIDLATCSFFSIISAISFYYLFKNETFELDRKELTVTSFNGLKQSKYRLKDLKSYAAIKKESENSYWEDLDLFFSTGKVRISSYNTGVEYLQIKNRVLEYANENTSASDRYHSKIAQNWGVGALLVGVIFCCIFINQDRQGNKIITESNTSKVTGVVSHIPNWKGVNGSRKLKLRLNSFPEHTFILNGSELKALSEKEFIDEVRKGDEIDIKIWKTTFDKKISKKHLLSFSDKHIDFENIDILGIDKSGREYLPLNDINKERKEFHTKTNFYALMFFALFVIGFGVYFIVLGRRLKTKQ